LLRCDGDGQLEEEVSSEEISGFAFNVVIATSGFPYWERSIWVIAWDFFGLLTTTIALSQAF
jgi:hypothetical protein